MLQNLIVLLTEVQQYCQRTLRKYRLTSCIHLKGSLDKRVLRWLDKMVLVRSPCLLLLVFVMLCKQNDWIQNNHRPV